MKDVWRWWTLGDDDGDGDDDDDDDDEDEEDDDDGDAKEWTQTSNAMYLTYLYPDFQNKEVQNERRAKNAISNALLRVLIFKHITMNTHMS